MANRTQERFAALSACALWLSCVPISALAHAQFVAGTPSPGAVLQESPAAIELRFNEPVEPIRVQVIDATGRDRLEAATAHAIDRHVRVELPVPLEAGAYLVSYRVISGDGHLITSAYGFAVGHEAVAPAALPESPTGRSQASGPFSSTRLVFMILLLAATGSALVLALLEPPPELRGWVMRLTRTLSIGGVVAAVIYAIAFGYAMVGSQDADPVDALAAVSRSSVGRSLCIALAGFVVLLIGSRRGSVLWLLMAAAVLCVSRVVTGHPASREPAWLLQPAMVLHVASAGFWFGALLPLWKACSVTDGEALVRLLKRFSATASGAIAVLVFAGLMMALVHLSAPSALTETTYGRLLTWKLLGVAGLLGIAAWNKLRLTPAIAAGEARAVGRLRRSIEFEGLLMLGVVALSTVVASMAPELPVAGAAASKPAGKVQAFTVESRSGEYKLNVRIDESAESATGVLEVVDAAGAPLVPVDVEARASLPSFELEDVELTVDRSNGTSAGIDLAPLTVPGTWILEVDVFVTDFDKETFEFQLDSAR
jgi:copper transport protein